MTSTGVLNTLFGFSPSDARARAQPPVNVQNPVLWNPRKFGEEQVRSLIRQLFFQGASTPRQVLFAGVDHGDGVREICLQVGNALSAQVSGSICIVEIGNAVARNGYHFHPDSRTEKSDTGFRGSPFQISKKLWLISSSEFQRDEPSLAEPWLRPRLEELQVDFDYTLFHTASAAHTSDALLIGHLCEGIVLILNANSTRRVTAKRTQERLSSANVHLLGTVLSERKFPIPESIYRRL